MYSFCIFSDIVLGSLLTFYMIIANTFKGSSFFRAYRLYIIINITSMVFLGLAFDFGQEMLLFKGLLYVDQLSILMKFIMIFFATIVILVRSRLYDLNDQPVRFLMFASLCQLMIGILVMAQHFIIMLICLLGASICLYALMLGESYNVLRNEAALKYMVQSSVALSLALLGLTFIYGSLGSLLATEMRVEVDLQSHQWLFYLGGAFFLILILFKLGVAPLHFWMIDLFQSASLATILLSSTLIKIGTLAIFFVFMRMHWMYPNFLSWVIQFAALFSIIWGSVVALKQIHLRRFLGYSAVVQMGFVLLSFAEQNWHSFATSFTYFFLYACSFSGVILILLKIQKSWEHVEYLTDLSGLHRVMPTLAIVLAVFLMSLAGIPPLAGFFAKIMVLQGLMRIENYFAVAGVLVGMALSVAYYLKAIKVVYFEQPRRPIEAVSTPMKRTVFLDFMIGFLLALICLYPLLSVYMHDYLLIALSPFKS